MINNPALGPALKELQSDTSGTAFFARFLPKFIGLGFLIGTVVFFFVFVVGAIQWITSGGDKQALEGARAKLSNGLIGLVILFSSYALIRLIEAFFGIDILALDIAGLKI